MFAVIVMGILLILGVILIVAWFRNDCYDDDPRAILGFILCLISLVIIPLSLLRGYLDHHKYSREEVVLALSTTPNKATIKMAKEWNADESEGNNLWCRFTLREENLIDIDQILIDYKGEESV